MQLAPQTLDEALLERYIGGEITLVSTTEGPSALVRGTLLGATVNDRWVNTRLTCREYAAGTLENIDDAIWHQSSDNPTHTLLHSSVQVIDDVLIFTDPTPKGNTAFVKQPPRQQVA